jgi:hypothetical protein
MRGPRKRPAIVLTTAAALAAVGAVSLATGAIPGGSGTINACYGSDGSVRVIDTEKSPPQTCSKGWTPLSWNQKGVAGAPGPQGEQGPKGDTGPRGEQGPAGTPATGFYAAKRAHVDLLPDAADLTIVSLGLPAGSYLLTGHTAAVNYGSPGYVRCGIKGAGKNSFGPDNFPGSAASVGAAPEFSYVGQVFVSLAVTSSEPFTAQLFCRQDISNSAYVEETRLMSTALGSIDVQGDS